MDSFMYNYESEIHNSKVIKNMVIRKLHEEGHISDEVATEYTDEWQILILKKDWFTKWFEKFVSTIKKGEYIYRLIKL